MLTSLIVVIISWYVCASKHHIVDFKLAVLYVCQLYPKKVSWVGGTNYCIMATPVTFSFIDIR